MYLILSSIKIYKAGKNDLKDIVNRNRNLSYLQID